jgi:hypothetical protein
MALDHALRALKMATPRMLPMTVWFIADKYKAELEKLGFYLEDRRLS